MKYDDLWKYWLEAHSQREPSWFSNLVSLSNKQNLPRPYLLKPRDMAAYANAFTPFDLYTRPNSTPMQTNPTTAVITDNPYGKIGAPGGTIMFSSETDPWQGLKKLKDYAQGNYNDIPAELKDLIPRAVYEHELGHYYDPRISPESYNKGYITKHGLPGEVANAEEPAMKAEDRFWRNAFFQIQRKKEARDAFVGKVKEAAKNNGGWLQSIYDMMK